MADRFWVGGDGNWSDDTNHWATSSGGAPGAGNLPTSSDNVWFDANSSGSGYTVTVNTSAVCLDFNMSNPTIGTVIWAGSSALNIAGSFTLGASLGTISYNGNITFSATSTGKTLTFAGNSTTAIGFAFSGSGGGWTFQDAMSGGSFINVSNGTVDTNGKTITVNQVTLSAGTLTLGASTLNLSNVWQATGGTLNANTSTINMGSGSANFDGNGFTYATVTLNLGGGNNLAVTGANTYGTLTITTGAIVNGSCSFSANQTVSGTFSATGNSVSNRILVRSNAFGTARTITAAAVSLTDVDFQDITAAGAASPFTGTRIGDALGNTSITATTPANKYWVGNTANWNAANVWATSSGGAGATNNFPLPQDTCIFDNGSFSANGQTVTFNGTYRTGALDFSAITKTITLASTFGVTCYGSLTMSSLMSASGTATHVMQNRSTATITSNTFPWSTGLRIEAFGSTVQLGDDMTMQAARALTVNNGTFSLNSGNLSVGSFTSTLSTGARTISLGNKTMTLTGTGTVLNLNTTLLTISSTTGTYKVTDLSATAKTLTTGGADLNGAAVWIATGYLSTTVISGNLTCGQFKVDASIVSLPGAGTLTATSLVATGTDVLTRARIVSSSASAVALTVSGSFDARYATFNGIAGVGTYAAGIGCADGGNNKNIVFDSGNRVQVWNAPKYKLRGAQA